MAPLLEKIALAAARRRPLLKIFGPLLPETAELEILSSFKVSLSLKDFTGPSFYLNHGGPAAFYHYEEAEKAEILRYLPADGVFLDIGANIGLFSLFFARFFPQAKVFAFEPHPVLSACLKRTCERNSLRNLRCESAALGASAGRFTLHLHARNSGGHSLLPSQITDEERGASVEVEVGTLDGFARREGLERLDVIKIDVQGAEWDVFAGAAESLERFSPVIVVEFENESLAKPEGAALAAWRALDKLGYRFRRVGAVETHALSEGERIGRAELEAGRLQTNYVLLPATRLTSRRD
jgi:FkbM family methyltransferase